MKRTADEILKTLKNNQQEIRKFGIKRIGLFGSISRNEGDEQSDLDFIVDFECDTFDAYMDLKIFLEDLFGCPVDLVLTNTIKPRIKETILKDVRYAAGF